MKNLNNCISFFFLLCINIHVAGQFSKPIIITGLSNTVNETSGLIFHKSELWTHNDSGNKAVLYSIDTVSGDIIRSVEIKNANNRDWEDLCKDQKYAYIGDFGNNSGKRDDLKIYKISLSDLSDINKTSIKAEIINFTYDKNIYPPKFTKKHNTNFDCEAFIAYKDSLYLFSKNWINQKTYLYALPKTPGTYTANLRDSLDSQGLICGADYNPNTNTIALIGYIKGIPAPSIILILYDYIDDNFFSGKTIRYETELSGYQTEAIAFKDNYNLWFTNEKLLANNQTLFSINIQSKNENTNQLKLRPYSFDTNISNQELHIHFDCPSKKCKTKIKLFDKNDNKLIKKNLLFNKSNKTRIIDISDLSNGDYSIQITYKNHKITHRFVN
ncbi:MAG: DUF3244 domain-containing protein [Bacteroidales bacterium]|nr:DUF3244 domain-containing protein [Bacteroidales bacterium]